MGLKISKEAIEELPMEVFPGKIIVVDYHSKIASAIDYLKNQSILGFDTETRPSFRRGRSNRVALLQLATMERCYLFRLNKIGYPKKLEDIICNTDIKKIGLSLCNDFAAMRKRSPRIPMNFVDLQKFVEAYQIDDKGLQKIYALLFGKKIAKNQRLTNWESVVLTSAQQAYAALDAWACLRIYNYLNDNEFEHGKL